MSFTQYLSNLNPKGECFISKIDLIGLIFELHPLNFGNQYSLLRCSNDAKLIF